MTTWINAIILGLKLYIIFTGAITLPLVATKASIDKCFNPMKFLANQMTVIYLACLAAVVFFPLPTASQAIGLTYRIQPIPGFAIWDIFTNPSVEAVLQVVFNVVMTAPWGILMRYRFGLSVRNSVISTLCLSLFIEIAQLTGLFFLYHGSFRLCDVDDLILNTLGGFIGCVIYSRIKNYLPSLRGREYSWNEGILMAEPQYN